MINYMLRVTMSSVKGGVCVDGQLKRGMMFFVLLPIPVSSVIYGLILKAKDYNYMKSLVIGIITAVVLILCGITFAS